jgi:hypothetical protein
MSGVFNLIDRERLLAGEDYDAGSVSRAARRRGLSGGGCPRRSDRPLLPGPIPMRVATRQCRTPGVSDHLETFPSDKKPQGCAAQKNTGASGEILPRSAQGASASRFTLSIEWKAARRESLK